MKEAKKEQKGSNSYKNGYVIKY